MSAPKLAAAAPLTGDESLPDIGYIPRAAYSPTEVAALIGFSYDSTIALIRSGEIPSIQVGKRYLTSHSVLVAFLKGREG